MTRLNPIDATQHLPGLRRYARALTQNETAADDLVQQALLRAIERSDTFKAGAPVRPWLFAILHNEYVSGRRRSRSEERAMAAFSWRDAPGITGPEQSALLSQTTQRFDILPEIQRSVLHLIAIEGMSYQQAADTLGLPIGTVMSRLSRARAALRAPAEQSTFRIVGGKDAS